MPKIDWAVGEAVSTPTIITNTRVLEYNYTNIQYLYWDYFLPGNICIDLTTASHH